MLLAGDNARAAWFSRPGFRESVVKIYATIQREDYGLPWQPAPPSSASGSGFLIRNKKILTNAHVVSDAKFIEVQREGQSQRFPAKVAFIGHDCDLAALTVDNPDFFNEAEPMALSDSLPDLNDEVIALGYPMGGERLSLTKGVVSRIDYQPYSHSQVDSHLVLQIDAAINPGNSGGPVLFRNQVVGVAFQGIQQAQDIGYAIPLPVMRHFLTDIEDGIYDGYPELGVAHLETPNPALRKDLGLPTTCIATQAQEYGVVISFVDPYGSAIGKLLVGDVLLSIDGHAIANDGTVKLDSHTVEYVELLERKQCGESVIFDVQRQGKQLQVTVPLVNKPDPFAFRYAYDCRAEYVIEGGLIFTPLSRGLLGAIAPELQQGSVHHLLYYMAFAKIDELYAGREQFVVLRGRLPHPVNTYDDAYLNRIVSAINGTPIRSLKDLPAAFLAPRVASQQSANKFHVISFLDEQDPLILDAAEAAGAEPLILQRYNIPQAAYLSPAPGGTEPMKARKP